MPFPSRNGQSMGPASGVPIVGQPFTIEAVGIPVNAVIRCHCLGGQTVEVILSHPATCPHCARVYNAVFDAGTGKIGITMTTPKEAPPDDGVDGGA